MLTATLIGDVLGSRSARDRSVLHERVQSVLNEVNARWRPVAPLRITVGDEYQGAFASVGLALQASMRLRLGILPQFDTRHGLGWGEVSVLSDQPRVEDGPGWWAARDAIDFVQKAEKRSATRLRRTAYRLAEGTPGPGAAAVGSALVLRDELVGTLDERSLSVLSALLSGSTQREIAESLGISASAVSQRVRADGLAALVAADELMKEVR